MSRTLWLASYPKSGNTWLRMLLANLDRTMPVDINAIAQHGGIASSRHEFDAMLLFPSGLLTHEECARLRPRVNAALASVDWAGEGEIRGVRFVKTHDAWSDDACGEPQLGGRTSADAAILIARDPRAVVPSLAHHFGLSLDAAIEFLADPAANLAGDRDRQVSQLRQLLGTWSNFNASWLDQRTLPVLLLRYEDLAADAAFALARALEFAEIASNRADCSRAARFAEFGALQRQEQAHGFGEAPRRGTSAFFRDGTTDGWRRILSPDQALRIARDHDAMMRRLGYSLVAARAEGWQNDRAQ